MKLPFSPAPPRSKFTFYKENTYSQAKKKKKTGSSRGRGSRAAGWFDDYIQKQKNSRMKSLTLAEGIKGWSGAGNEYTALMDGYEEEVWRKGEGEK